MSNPGSFQGRRSWRRNDRAESGGRTGPRIAVTVIAVALIALFAYVIWRGRPSRRTNTVLISAETFDLDVMMPLMYGGAARDYVRDTLSADLVRGQADGVLRQFRENVSVRERLLDPDDSFVLFVRGYLLAGSDGEPSIACSDLAVGDGDLPDRGLLPVSELLEPLATVGPESGDGHRLVVLDVEPLAADPRLGQRGDAVFESLRETVRGLGDRPLGDRVWVLVTRGPLENAGWDHRNGMPVSTRSFLEAVAGGADFDENYEIRLDEVCDFMAARYRRLAGGRDEPTHLMLLRGGVGTVERTADAGQVWVARTGDATFTPPGARDRDEAESDEGSANGSGSKRPDQEGSDPASTAAIRRDFRPPGHDARIVNRPIDSRPNETGPRKGGSVVVRPVRFSPDEPEPRTRDGRSGERAGDTIQAGDTAKDRDADQVRDTVQDRDAADVRDSAGTETEKGPTLASDVAWADEFWQTRDRLESTAASGSLGPVGLTPHLWRLLVRQVLHAEIETLDGQSGSRAARAQRAVAAVGRLARDLEAGSLDSGDSGGAGGNGTAIRADASAGNGSGPGGAIVEVDAIAAAWRQWRSRRSGERVDEQVRAADRLQQAVAIAKSRIWNWLDYQNQAIVGGGTGLGDDSGLREWTERGEALLHEQQGSTVDAAAMVDRRDRIVEAVERFDRSVASEIDELLRSLSRGEPKDAWGLIRRGDAWLRSPLPSGPQRQKLRAAIRDTAGRVPDDLADTAGTGRPTAAELSAGRAEGPAAEAVRQWEGVYRQTVAAEGIGLIAVDGGANAIARGEPLWADDADPVRRVAAALRIDPRDTARGIARDRSAFDRPVGHRVAAKPRVPMPTLRITDASGEPLESLQLPDTESSRSVLLTLRPDSDRPTRLAVAIEPTGSQLDVRWGEPEWRDRPTNRPREVAIGAGEQRDVAVEIAAADDSGVDGFESEIEIRVTASDGESLSGLTGVRKLAVRLPRRNRVRLALTPRDDVGFSETMVSGQGDLPDGVWLRTYVNRTTPFRMSVFNDAGRAAQARVWLIRLDDPFASEGIRGYWPGMQRRELDGIARRIRDLDGRVVPRLLAAALKGPAEIELPADRVRVPVRWTRPEAKNGAEGDRSAAAPAPGDGGENGASSAVDVSHGMAIVVRMLDASGEPMRQPDQIVWMIPKPWDPESYIDLPLVQYREGQVRVRAAIKSRVDGDDRPERIPEIAKRPVLVRWVEDDQWTRHRAGSRRTPRFRLLELSGAESSTMELPVPDRERTFVRLEVDGWPRAIHRVVEHREGAEGRSYTQRNTIDFLSVEIDHGEPPPTSREEDDPIVPGPVWYPGRVVFRGGGQRIVTRVAADFSSLLLEGYDRSAGNSPPELIVSVNDASARRYWTDRVVGTVATELGDDGGLTLRTTVDDPVLEWTTEARREDTLLRFAAELRTDGARRNDAATDVTLDSTSPVIDRPTRDGGGDPEVGRQIRWDYRCRDVGPGGRPGSGIARVHFGIDADGDRNPDDKNPPDELDEPRVTVSASGQGLTRSFVPEEPGLHHVVIRAWDGAGLASQPAVVPFVVKPKPAAEETMKPAKLGAIRGRIATGLTMRGTISLSPAPPGIQPASGAIECGGANPTFAFRNLPDEKYTLTFRGTVDNVLKTLEWADLVTDVAEGGSLSISLSLDRAEAK